MVIKHGRHVFGEIHEVRKGLWAFFLTAFRMLIGLGGKLEKLTNKEQVCITPRLTTAPLTTKNGNPTKQRRT